MFSNKWPKYFFILLTFSSFGPYILKGAGIRTEHFVIYPAFVIAFLFFLFKLSSYKVEKNLFIFTSLWLVPLIWITIVSFGLGGQALSSGSLSAIENFLQPLAIMTFFVVLSRYYELATYFFTVLKVFLLALGVNSVIIITQVLVDPELFGILDYFTRSLQETTVAERAATMGRFLGIFDQPLEAGACYSLGILSWLYLENIQKNYSKWIKYILICLLFIGGVVTVSKVFVIGGIVLFLGYVLFFSRSKIRRRFLYTVPFLFGVVAYYLVTSMWEGLNYLLRLFKDSGDAEGILAKYTAGRFGTEDSVVRKVFTQVYRESPLYGFGFTPPPTLDNGFAEFFYHGGAIGLFFYTILLVWLLYKGIEMYLNRGKSYVIFLFLVALILGLNLGAPAFTLNRFSVNITMSICFLFLMARDNQKFR